MIADRLTGRMMKVLAGIATYAFALSIALPIAFIALSSAAADSDLYVEYSGGLSIVRNQNIAGDDASGANLSGKVESDAGFNIGAAFGKRFHEHFRSEIQLTYRENEVSNLSLRNEPDNAEGHIGLLAIMANGYVDWDLGIGVVPYVGAGIGWGSVEIEAKNGAAFQTKINGRDSVFAWSLMVGGSYPLNEVLDLSLGYRYIATTDPKINSGLSDPPPSPNPDDLPVTRVARRLKAEFDAHEVVLGLRFNF